MTKAVFVSDIHIADSADARAVAFARFLDRCLVARPSHLFLVGDVFDLWIADRGWFVNRYADLIAKLKAVVATGCEVHYFEGNHDLDLEVFFARELGVFTHDRPFAIELSGRRVWIEHGDEMDPKDRGYRFLRWFLRTKLLRFLGRHLPDRVVRWIGERASAASRRYTSEIKTSSDDRARLLMREHVARLRRHHRFDLFVAGHVHVAEDVEVDGIRIVNLGTWLKEPLVLVVEPKSIVLSHIDSFRDTDRNET